MALYIISRPAAGSYLDRVYTAHGVHDRFELDGLGEDELRVRINAFLALDWVESFRGTPGYPDWNRV